MSATARSRLRPTKAGLRVAGAYELYLATHLHHVDNEFYNEPFLLDDWQRDHIWNPIFATGRMVNGRYERRVRRALIGLPRDGGKTETAAAALLTIANMEPVHGGEYGIIASSKTQAKKAFRKIKSMILQDPELSAAWEVLTDTIKHRETDALIIVLPYSEAAAQSWHFNVCIIDELHVHKSTDILDAVISGQKSIFNALTIVITTAGPHRSGPLWDTLEAWKKDPAAHVYWLGAADSDRIDDPKVWAKVSPMSWITLAHIEDQFNSTSRRSFERYTLNRFPLTKDTHAAVSPRQLARAVAMPSKFDFERPFCLGIDGAQSGDALAIIGFQEDDAGDQHFFEHVFDEPPEETGTYDLVQLEEIIAEIVAKYGCDAFADPNRLLLLCQHLDQNYGVEVVSVAQLSKVMCPASSLLVNAVRQGTAHLGGCPKLAQHLDNAVLIEKEPWGERLSSVGSGESKKRIDAAIAAAIAMFGAKTQPKKLPSFASTGGFHSISL